MHLLDGEGVVDVVEASVVAGASVVVAGASVVAVGASVVVVGASVVGDSSASSSVDALES